MSSDSAPAPSMIATPSPRRVLGRRSGLPNGRAVLGALLVTVAGIGTFATASARSDADHARYVVLVRPVAPGARLHADDLALRPLGLDADVAGQAFTDPTALAGAVALGPLGAGQVLARAAVALPGEAARNLPPANELTIPLAADRLPAGLRRGETVAVLATAGSGDNARTVVTVQGARVLAVAEADGSLAGRGSARLTLSLTDAADVVETAHAAHVAEITIVRSTFADGPLPEVHPAPAAGPPGASSFAGSRTGTTTTAALAATRVP